MLLLVSKGDIDMKQGLKEEDKKVTIVNGNDNNDDDRKKNKKKRLIVLIALLIFLIIDIVCGIIFIPKIINKLNNKNKESTSSYVMDEYTKNRYNNLLSYINDLRIDSTYEGNISEITALTYDKPHLCVSYQNDNEPGYIEVEIDDKENIDEILEMFKDGHPTAGTYTYAIQKETFNTHKTINISSSLIKGHVSTYGVVDYLSCTYVYNDTTLCSLTNEEYSDEGLYNNIVKVTEQEDKLLFDLYYYLLK